MSRPTLTALLTAYLTLLTWAIMWKLNPPYIGRGGFRPVKLVPFIASGEFGANAASEVAANLVVFIPFGVLLALLCSHRPWWRLGLIMFATSFAYETLQFVLAVGTADSSDLIANTSGGLIGIGLVRCFRTLPTRSGAPVLPRAAGFGILFAASLSAAAVALLGA